MLAMIVERLGQVVDVLRALSCEQKEMRQAMATRDELAAVVSRMEQRFEALQEHLVALIAAHQGGVDLGPEIGRLEALLAQADTLDEAARTAVGPAAGTRISTL